MHKLIDNLKDLFIALSKYPEKYSELGAMLKDILNSGFENKIICDKVFITKGSDDYKEPLVLIPLMPTSDILKTNNIKYYDLEINVSNLSDTDYSVEEYIVWLIHEICENLITDNTLIRFKKMLITKYNNAESGIKSVIRNLGYIMWIGVFSRTNKEICDSTSNNFFINYLKETNLDFLIDSWNSALSKYISKNGGDHKILTDEYLDYKDNSDFLTFNKLARRYSSYGFKYNDTEYSTFVKYLLAGTNSELLKYYISREPKHLAIFKEKEIFNVFNDNKILYESSSETELYKGSKTRNYVNEYSELALDVDNVITVSDKIRTAVKLKDFQVDITKALETDILNNAVLQDLRERTNKLVIELNTKKCEPSIMEEFI